MSTIKRLDRLLETAPRIPFSNKSKIVFFSDCHRGEGGWADNFAKNQNIYFHALNHYYENGFTYFELGDGEELWENKSLSSIVDNYRNIYRLFARFYNKNRLHVIYGNHDMEKKDPNKTKCFDKAFCSRKNCMLELCPGIKFYEAIVLRHKESKSEILLAHGHQADFLNYNLWRLARFLVRYIWKPLETIGVRDPTSAAKNYKRRIAVERKLIEWVEKRKLMLIAGHTHRPVFPSPEEPPYFNDGSCVHPRCITCIEIDNGEIMLVKWAYFIRKDGTVYVGRELLENPRKLPCV
jgi:UDP-2,3-diacylglucosamine pyrophosphatase LpxH